MSGLKYGVLYYYYVYVATGRIDDKQKFANGTVSNFTAGLI